MNTFENNTRNTQETSGKKINEGVEDLLDSQIYIKLDQLRKVDFDKIKNIPEYKKFMEILNYENKYFYLNFDININRFNTSTFQDFSKPMKIYKSSETNQLFVDAGPESHKHDPSMRNL